MWRRSDFIGTEVKGKTLGIIGLGRVGSEVARRALGLEMKLIAYNPFISADYARNVQIELVSLETLLKQADFISLHTPLTAATKNLINAQTLALVKPTVRIINTARGELVDENALAKAVKEGKVAGAVMRGETHIVRFGNYWIDITPSDGYLLFTNHRDRPGILGAVGRILGDGDVNISYMHVSRHEPRGLALMVLALDEAPSEEQLQQIRSVPDIYTVRLVKL